MSREKWLEAARFVQQEGYDLVVSDFGGTLFDFNPVHSRAFFEALVQAGLQGVNLNLIQDMVEQCILAGDDSFEMSEKICKKMKFGLDSNSIAVDKRQIVEVLISEARLEVGPKMFLEEVATSHRQVAVITRGLESSLRKIILSSLSGVKGSEDFFLEGRQSAREKVDKVKLFERVIKFCANRKKIVYFGDSAEDKNIADAFSVTFCDCHSV